MKKAMFIFLTVYILAIGGYYLFTHCTATQYSNNGQPNVETNANYNEGISLQWDVETGKNGNYVPVDLATQKQVDPSLDENIPPTIPNDRLMNVFDLANRDYYSDAFAVFDIKATQPDVADPDNFNHMDKFLTDSFNAITHYKTLKTVNISNPKNISETEMTYDLRVEYKDGKFVQTPAVPMVKIENDWYVNMRLSDFVKKFK